MIYLFVPLADITAYELAVIVQNVSYGLGASAKEIRFTTEAMDALDPSIKRHFKEKGTS